MVNFGLRPTLRAPQTLGLSDAAKHKAVAVFAAAIFSASPALVLPTAGFAATDGAAIGTCLITKVLCAERSCMAAPHRRRRLCFLFCRLRWRSLAALRTRSARRTSSASIHARASEFFSTPHYSAPMHCYSYATLRTSHSQVTRPRQRCCRCT